MTPESDAARSSRRRAIYAGWRDPAYGNYAKRMPGERVRSSWLRPAVLWQSRNDRVAAWIRDNVNEQRRAWVQRRARQYGPDLTIDRSDLGDFSFLMLGDTGEGDASQWAVAEALRALAGGTAFMMIASDVTYPTGEIGDYQRKFLDPYNFYTPPVYAVPGNHDWYDSLQGFMFSFCNEEPPAPRPIRRGFGRVDPREPLRLLLWRRSPAIESDKIDEYRNTRRLLDPPQPGPYFAIDTERVRIVGIDTGISNALDAGQAQWLRSVSAGPKPKILVTGKPIYVDNKYSPTPIESPRPFTRWNGHVDEIVTDPKYRYVAAFGGDIHNYQRYPVRVRDGRTIQYVVCGGGGAFMHATHTIPKVSVGGVDERDFRCYPLRGDSLSFYSRLYDERLGILSAQNLAIEADVAGALLAARLGIDPRRDDARRAKPTEQDRWAFQRVVGRSAGKGFQRFFSEFFDNDRPPFFKHFLRVDVSGWRLTVRCFAVTGWLEDEQDPPEEDCFVIDLKTLLTEDYAPG